MLFCSLMTLCTVLVVLFFTSYRFAWCAIRGSLSVLQLTVRFLCPLSYRVGVELILKMGAHHDQHSTPGSHSYQASALPLTYITIHVP